MKSHDLKVFIKWDLSQNSPRWFTRSWMLHSRADIFVKGRETETNDNQSQAPVAPSQRLT